MLKRLSPREQIAVLLDTYTAELQRAFLEAVATLKADVVLSAVIDRLQAGDIEGAIAAFNLDRAPFNPLIDALQRAYAAGGGHAVDGMPTLRDPAGHRVVVRFDARNLRAEAFLRSHSSALVTGVLDEQRASIRTALATGLSRGANPKTTALDIVGRLDRAAGMRTGGLLGLSAPQMAAVENARQRLSVGTPETLREYLALGRRDRRFDKTVLAAIDSGKPIPADMQTRMLGRLADRYLQLRGEVLAQNETHVALFAGKHEAFQQAIDAGKLSPDAVTKTWRHFPSEHEREQHVAMQGKAVGFNEPFILPDGTPMAYPHAPGAPARHVLGCKCQADYKVDHIANYLARRAA